MVCVILQHGHPDGQKNDRNLQTLLIVNNLQCTVESGRDSVFTMCSWSHVTSVGLLKWLP